MNNLILFYNCHNNGNIKGNGISNYKAFMQIFVTGKNIGKLTQKTSYSIYLYLVGRYIQSADTQKLKTKQS